MKSVAKQQRMRSFYRAYAFILNHLHSDFIFSHL